MRKVSVFFPLLALLLALLGALFWLGPALQAANLGQDDPPAPADLALSPIQSNADWETLQATGLLTVGVSASSPPFAFYTPAFEIDGFDAALLEAIAGKLGVQLALVDYAFDGLPAALQVGQIDAVAAALTMTPERAAVVDFSMPYYLSSEALLAAPGSALNKIDLNTQDFTNVRLGIQRGTVYAAWAKTHLLDTGRMPATNLEQFNREQEIVRALQEGSIDVGLMDFLPAQEYVRAGEATLAGSNQILQQYAIAVRKGSSLLPQINLALTQLQQDGTLAKLHATYLSPDEEAPQPAPTPVPAPPPACQDVSGYVADLTYADNDANIPFVPAGQPFVKSWRLINHGTCPWTKGYALVYAPMPGSRPDDRMGGVSAQIQGVVQPGQTVDLSASLLAPLTPGVYKGVWQMVNAQGQPFGQRVWVRVQVPGGKPPTPAPTPTPARTPTPTPFKPAPAPAVIDYFVLDATSIAPNQCVNASWSVGGGVTAVTVLIDDYPVANGLRFTGSQQFCPPSSGGETLKFALFAQGMAATPPDARVVYVQVQPNPEPTATLEPMPTLVPEPPVIDYFGSDVYQVNAGECANLYWSVGGWVDIVQLYRNGSHLADVGANDGRQECLYDPGTVNYRLRAANGAGLEDSRDLSIDVVFMPGPLPDPDPEPGPLPDPVDPDDPVYPDDLIFEGGD